MIISSLVWRLTYVVLKVQIQFIPKQQRELLDSHLQPRNLLDRDVRITSFRSVLEIYTNSSLLKTTWRIVMVSEIYSIPWNNIWIKKVKVIHIWISLQHKSGYVAHWEHNAFSSSRSFNYFKRDMWDLAFILGYFTKSKSS